MKKESLLVNRQSCGVKWFRHGACVSQEVSLALLTLFEVSKYNWSAENLHEVSFAPAGTHIAVGFLVLAGPVRPESLEKEILSHEVEIG